MTFLHFSDTVRLVGIAALASMVGTVACGGHGDDPKPPESVPSHRVAIHAYAGPERRRVDFVPRSSKAEADAAKLVGGLTNSPSPTGKALGPKSVVATTATNDAYMFNEEFLLYSAAMECAKAPYVADASTDVWATGRWFYMTAPATTCDQQLAYEENMLCAAQKLTELADAVAPVVWSKAPNGPYTFPPQATADRVVVRDLALEVLANLAATDMRTLSTGRYEGTCAEQYSRVWGGVVQADLDPEPTVAYLKMSELDTIFDPATASPYFDGDAGLQFRTLVDPAALPKRLLNAPKLAKSRLQFEAHVLRAASRLGEKLIRESVEDDLAGAEKRRSEAVDPLLGARAAWGLTGVPEEDSYNTLTHATRVLFGKLDESRFPPVASLGVAGAANCALDASTSTTITRNELLAKGYGADLSARTNDLPARTAVQRAAVRLVEAAGIVIPPSAITGDLDAVRTALRKQLLASSAEDLGTTAALLELEPRGRALIAAVKDSADEDLRFALMRSFQLFRMLANYGEQTPIPTGTDVAGLRRRTSVVSELTALGGTAFKALSRVDLAHDFTARAGIMQDAGQCPTALQFQLPKALRLPYQSAPAMLQTLFHRMGDLRRNASGAGIDDVVKVADVARVEMREAAGPGLIISYFDANYILVMTFGLEKPGTDLLSPAEIRESLVLAYGPPWVADCVAGLRESCPSDMTPYLGQTGWATPYDQAASGRNVSIGLRQRFSKMSDVSA